MWETQQLYIVLQEYSTFIKFIHNKCFGGNFVIFVFYSPKRGNNIAFSYNHHPQFFMKGGATLADAQNFCKTGLMNLNLALNMDPQAVAHYQARIDSDHDLVKTVIKTITQAELEKLQAHGRALGKMYGPINGKKVSRALGKKYGPIYGPIYGLINGKMVGPALGKKYGPIYGPINGKKVGRALGKKYSPIYGPIYGQAAVENQTGIFAEGGAGRPKFTPEDDKFLVIFCKMFNLVHKGDHWRMVSMYMNPKFDEHQCRLRWKFLDQQKGLIRNPTPLQQQFQQQKPWLTRSSYRKCKQHYH